MGATSRLSRISKEIKFLKRIEIFEHLNDSDLKVVHNAMFTKRFEKNDNIVSQGEDSTHFYIICQGKCDVIKHNDEQKEDQIISSLVAGDFFGELGIIKSQPRTATIRVTSNQLVAYFLIKQDFNALLDFDEFRDGINKKITSYDQNIDSSDWSEEDETELYTKKNLKKHKKKVDEKRLLHQSN